MTGFIHHLTGIWTYYMQKMNKTKSVISGIICFIVLVLFDQFTKKLAVIHLKDQNPIILINNVFQLYYLENHGAAFGILQGQRFIFLLITIVILVIIIYCYIKLPMHRKYRFLRVFIIFIGAGALGNAIDRSMQGYVVDFFYFNLINFPIFNVADIYVTCFTILLVIIIIFRIKDDDLNEIAQSLGLKNKDNTNL